MNTEGKQIHLFYADQLYGSWSAGSFTFLHDIPPEIYNGGYLLHPGFITTGVRWYRCDLTPVRDEYVPKELKMLVLLMGL